MTDRTLIRAALAGSARGDWADLVSAIGFTPTVSPLDYLSEANTAVSGAIRDVAVHLHRVGGFETGAARAGMWVATLPDWGDRPASRERARRRVAKALVELAPAADRNVLFILTAAGVDDVEFVLPRQRANGALGTVRALVSRSQPNRHHLELLESLELDQGAGTAAITRRWNDAFSVERVTDSFYKEFRLLRNRLVDEIAAANPGHPMLEPGDDEAKYAELRRFVTRNLGRVLFLWFIQAKGWLDGDPSYLVNLYGRASSDARSFFTEALVPLFFDTLAVETEARKAQTITLGDVPYLNGGLFVPTVAEDLLYGESREHVDIIVPNELFDPRAHDGGLPTVLGLLSSYRFTTQESTPDDLSLDPDPELLGKVFENLNEERKKTGTFYTPREVVRFMCREALDGHLTDATGVDRDTLAALRLEAVDPESTDVRLTAERRRALQECLLSVTVCDPAVGSGAFPVGMMQEIVQLLIGIEQSADVWVHVGGQQVSEWKERIITHCLYGVDINPEAVEICQLRLWLSMVVDAERPVPLPNLDFRFEAGDSLVDRIGEMRLRETLPREAHQEQLLFESLSEVEADLEKLRDEYAVVRDSHRARDLRAAIKQKQLELVQRQVEDLIAGLDEQLLAKRARLDQVKRLGGGARGVAPIEKEVRAIVERRGLLERVLHGLSPNAPSKKPFLWPVEFPEVFDSGGFDIVIANPPYVRQEKLAPEDQQTYSVSFNGVHSGTADLLVYFFARAMQILNNGGRIAFITSNKFHRAGYGEGLRDYLPTMLQLEHVVDFGDLSVFAAIAYPSILVGRRAEPDSQASVSVAVLTHPIRRALAEAGSPENVGNVREQLENLEGLLARHVVADFPQALLRKEGWVLEDPKLVRLFDRLALLGVPLGDFVQGRMYRGVLSGLNEAFVIDDKQRAELIAADARSAELIKPWLRGRDIKRWKPESAGLFFIAIQSSGDGDSTNPWRMAKSEAEARRTFSDSYPAVHEHVSTFEDRLRPRADQGRWWWELRSCTYYKEFERPKIMWADIALRPRFAFIDAPAFCDTTVFMASRQPKWLVPVANSTLAWAVFSSLAPSIQGGHLRFKSGYIERFPVVVPDDALRLRLEELEESARCSGDAVQDEVDAAVNELYRVTPGESVLLRKWFDERTYVLSAEEAEPNE